MARRVKEEPAIHRKRIAKAAEELFEKKGIESTTMSEIAKEAGYSKATLYVYFQNKEEIVGFLVLRSMTKLRDYISAALESEKEYKEKYMDICHAMTLYEEEYPFYFSMALNHINIDFEHSACEESERETFRVGEEINALMGRFFQTGIEKGVFKPQQNIAAIIFGIWGMLSGCIQLASNKQEYIAQEMHMDKAAFLETNFHLLYLALEQK